MRLRQRWHRWWEEMRKHTAEEKQHQELGARVRNILEDRFRPLGGRPATLPGWADATQCAVWRGNACEIPASVPTEQITAVLKETEKEVDAVIGYQFLRPLNGRFLVEVVPPHGGTLYFKFSE